MITIHPHPAEKIHHQIDRNRLLGEFKRLLPLASILTEAEALRPYECDGLSVYHCLPWLVLLPETVDQIQQIMRICHSQGVPVVARGGGTGLAGGALPLDNGVLLVLSKLNKILEVDPDNRQARVQPGVRNIAVSEAARPYGLFYAPDPSSQIACTLGGNVAENSGGVHCLKYGLTTHNVLEAKIVTMDGELVTLGGGGLDSPGLDLLALMIGSEGLLGIAVEITVKLLPLPEETQVLLAAFDDVEKAGRAVAGIIEAGLLPAGLEMMDHAIIQATEDFIGAGYPREAEAILIAEFDGMREQVEEDLANSACLLKACGAYQLAIANTPESRQKAWAGRKAAFPAAGRISPDYYCMDGTIPRRFLAATLKKIAKLSEDYGLAVANVFHAGDGNLHPLILYDAGKPGELDRAEQLGGAILGHCVAVGGTITGEHGVGIEKLNQMCLQFSASELMQFQALKRAFDPQGLLNPGKAIPSLHRCAEWGAMHVHQGNLRFPDIERF
ncbi:FAD-linked oxidase C-terminal domain-containing protein [Methylomicrobium sp. Wu6]|uniref:FAD-linked oxidase C-terminal domain-containing protein n=1 Tax=Methylomicrobium sp. Wu6 TaxID=3107928 RepID=UPI002DD6A1E6|nr:FAD-linked oxidase C-terminal domain-containing protein [Methylomicrobium sp. Wu6]MEC4749518.1 FAD-linked oxidase C-terminal domain-containing protein [Methylomicrobium sp. Wu6]